MLPNPKKPVNIKIKVCEPSGLCKVKMPGGEFIAVTNKVISS